MKLKKLIITLITLLSIIIVGCGNDKTPTEKIYEMYMYPKTEFNKISTYLDEAEEPQNKKIYSHLGEIMEQNDENIKILLNDKLNIKEVEDKQQKRLLENFANTTAEYLQAYNLVISKMRNSIDVDKKLKRDDVEFLSMVFNGLSSDGVNQDYEAKIDYFYKQLLKFEKKESKSNEKNEVKNIKNNGGNTSYRLFNPGKYLNNDQELPMVMTRQGVSWYVDCRSAEILEKNGNATTVRFDLLIVNDDGMDRQSNELRLWTGKGVAVDSNASGSWQPINEMTATRAQYNAGLILIDYLGLN